MNNVGLRFRENLSGVFHVIQEELDGIIAGIQGSWNIEHKPTGTHGDISVDSLTLNTRGQIDGDIRLKGQQRWLQGPWFLDEPGVVGTHIAMLRPAQITADQDDYAPGGINTAIGLELDADADDRVITGISQSRVQKRLLFIVNIGSYRLKFAHEDSGSTATNRLDLPSDLPAYLDSGSYVWLYYDTSIRRWRMMLTGFGGQYRFPATQNPSTDANTLDDFEEGTWTPTIGGTSTASTEEGQYTKIGKVVLATFNFRLTAVGSGSTTILSGLPFAASGGSGNVAGSIGYFDQLATSTYWLGGYTVGSTIKFTGQAALDANVDDGFTVFADTTGIVGTVVYHAAS